MSPKAHVDDRGLLDALGRIESKSETILGTTKLYEYGYDERGRLADVTTDSVATAHYDYDANGNRIGGFNLHGAIGADYDEQDRLTSYTAGPLTADYAYSVNGELESKTVGTDVTEYTYDVLGNLTEVVLPSTDTISYSIDGRDRRTVRQATGEAERRWLWSGQLTPVAELDASDAVTSRFAYATKTNVPDYLVRGGVTYRILTDQLGSPRLVIDATTPDLTISQRIAQQLEHDEFGNVTTDVVATGFTRIPFGFAGGLDDPRTGLVRFGARDYDPAAARWTAKDPIGFGAGDENLFGYASVDPVNGRDPTGLVDLSETSGSMQLQSNLVQAKAIQAPGVSRQALAGLCRAAKELLSPFNKLGGVTRGSGFDRHHIFQDAAMKALGFERGLGIAIPLVGGRGGAHAMASALQQIARGKSSRYIAYSALLAAGCKPSDATEIVQAAENFAQLSF